MAEKDTQRVLEGIGLPKKEALAYITLLKLGDATAYAVAKQSGLKTPTAYVVLDNLREKGMVLKVPKKRGWLYRAKEPDEFFNDQKERLGLLERILPLLRMTGHEETQTDVLVFEGIKEAREGMWYGMDSISDFVGFYSSAREASPALVEVMLEWNKEVSRRGVSSRAIVPDDASLALWRKLDPEHKRNVKKIPFEDYPSDTSLEIHKTFVRIIIIPESRIIIIKNKNLSSVLKYIFEIAWKAV